MTPSRISVIHYHHATLLPWQWWLTMGLIVLFGVLLYVLWVRSDVADPPSHWDLLREIERNTRR